MLETEAGERVEVTLRPDWVLRHAVERRASFGALIEDPLALEVLDHAPGDHVEVKLRGVVLGPGDRVTVAGTVERALAWRPSASGRSPLPWRRPAHLRSREAPR